MIDLFVALDSDEHGEIEKDDLELLRRLLGAARGDQPRILVSSGRSCRPELAEVGAEPAALAPKCPRSRTKGAREPVPGVTSSNFRVVRGFAWVRFGDQLWGFSSGGRSRTLIVTGSRGEPARKMGAQRSELHGRLVLPTPLLAPSRLGLSTDGRRRGSREW